MTLPRGLLFDILTAAGFTPRGSGDKRSLRCPIHDDRTASAFASAHNVFYCSVCTPDVGWSTKTLCGALGLPWNAPDRPLVPALTRVPVARAPEPGAFTSEDGRLAWRTSFARARDDERVEEDRDVHDYIAERRLGEALELGAYGVLPTDGLHPALAKWPWSGHRLVAPLFDQRGDVVSIQARAIRPTKLKVLNPKGSRVAGTVFADRAGQRVLAGERADRIVFGEGLTDMLALATTSPWPVLTAPGTSNAANAVGPWANGAEVLLTLDCDAVGNQAVGPVSERLFAHGARRIRRVTWPGAANDACACLAQCGDVALHEFLVALGGEVS